MRIGVSPTRAKRTDYRPAQVTVAVLVHIPEQAGYFTHRFDVLKLCLTSIVHHTDGPYDLMVFDNGSCAEIVNYLRGLRDQGVIRYLILSAQNIGKMGAFQILFRAAPGNIIAYCDDDIFFYPGWLPAHLRILETFPNVGMVSGWAIRHNFSYGIQSCLELAETDPDVRLERTQRIPDEWEIDFAISTGRDPEGHLATTAEMQDIVLHYNGVSAFATANHFQFVSPKSVIVGALPGHWGGWLVAKDEAELDEAVDAAGYLRLSTIDRYVRHIGNVISLDIEAEADRMGLEAPSSEVPAMPSLLLRLAQQPRVRGVLKRVYAKLFWILSLSSVTGPVARK